MDSEPKIAVFPGTFDPLTNGHVDVIDRGRRLFDRLIVAVGENPDKAPLFAADERVSMIRELVRDWPNVVVEAFAGLTVDYVRSRRAVAILRGIRSTIDLPHELQQAYTNRTLSGIETVFILTTEEHSLISSSMIKQVAGMGGDVSQMAPALVVARLRERLKSAPAKPRLPVSDD
ncbi:MAG: pantetheine-phosphate adenylyltransferase [Phycisphaerae bacterium]|nr:pantetheine-phosphate adenylyltransferase [Phycisphaerae bacterium]